MSKKLGFGPVLVLLRADPAILFEFNNDVHIDVCKVSNRLPRLDHLRSALLHAQLCSGRMAKIE